MDVWFFCITDRGLTSVIIGSPFLVMVKIEGDIATSGFPFTLMLKVAELPPEPGGK